MSETVVPYYGIHWNRSKVAFLMQGRSGTNAIGLRERPPFIVRLPGPSRHCNHMIPLTAPVPSDYHWDYFSKLLDDPLARAMLPIPKQHGGAFWLDDPENELLETLLMLSKLSSPIYPIVVPMRNLTPASVITELQTTNVQPFVVTGVQPTDGAAISQIGQAAVYAPRTIVMTGSSDVIVPTTFKKITTQLHTERFSYEDLMTLSWESLGATVVRKFMRGEWAIIQEEKGVRIPEAKSPPVNPRPPARTA